MALSPVGAVKLGLWNQPCVYANLSVHLRLYSRGFVIETSSFDRRERGLSQSPCRNRRVGKNKPYDAAALLFISFRFISFQSQYVHRLYISSCRSCERLCALSGGHRAPQSPTNQPFNSSPPSHAPHPAASCIVMRICDIYGALRGSRRGATLGKARHAWIASRLWPPSRGPSTGLGQARLSSSTWDSCVAPRRC